MAKKVSVSFKDTELEKEIYEYLEEKAKLIGNSNYIKQLIYSEMLRDRATEK